MIEVHEWDQELNLKTYVKFEDDGTDIREQVKDALTYSTDEDTENTKVYYPWCEVYRDNELILQGSYFFELEDVSKYDEVI